MTGVMKVLVVPHIHWDREWYLTAEEFSFYLAKALDWVLELLATDKDFVFTLDGQVITILDYIAVFPSRREELVRYVRQGRLKIGPRYVQSDEFLVSGESLIRNLLLGRRLAKQFGGAMLVGYLPDAFGHIAQLPQILLGFGINTAFFMRGADLACETAGGAEFRWRAPDGSTVCAHVFTEGYDAARDLTDVHEELLRRLLARTKTGLLLLPLGGDHRAPPPDFPKRWKRMCARWKNFAFSIGSFEDYAAVLQEVAENLPLIAGELRASRFHFILAGVLSTRIPLKQANFRIQNLLERYAEPLSALALSFGGLGFAAVAQPRLANASGKPCPRLHLWNRC